MNPNTVQHPASDIALPVQVGDDLFRVTAPNPGPMTGNGTNTYLVRAGEQFAVIDPGPDDDIHIQAILAAAGGAEKIALILVTHMHPDHSPAATPLARLSGAMIYGWQPVDDEYQDATCIPDYIVQHNEVVMMGEQRIRCLHTPGHVDNHVCYLLENEQVVMTGDHIMQGSTVVIIPPHGNMKSYIESLQLLTRFPVRKLAPGHGEMILTPQQEINGIIAHRLAREAKVLDALEQYVRAPIDELLEVVYSDVHPSLHPFAELSLLAHLIKLEEERRVYRENGKWVLIP
jgi:glyoxylase-like metal-dependent hydrolase (beta-lactamase superfamily II)